MKGFLAHLGVPILMPHLSFIYSRSIAREPVTLRIITTLDPDVGISVNFLYAAILAAPCWTTLARRVRSKLLTLRNEDFIQAARVAGCSNYRLV